MKPNHDEIGVGATNEFKLARERRHAGQSPFRKSQRWRIDAGSGAQSDSSQRRERAKHRGDSPSPSVERSGFLTRRRCETSSAIFTLIVKNHVPSRTSAYSFARQHWEAVQEFCIQIISGTLIILFSKLIQSGNWLRSLLMRWRSA